MCEIWVMEYDKITDDLNHHIVDLQREKVKLTQSNLEFLFALDKQLKDHFKKSEINTKNTPHE